MQFGKRYLTSEALKESIDKYDQYFSTAGREKDLDIVASHMFFTCDVNKL